ncbi:UvrD-helicase domain-containing protein [Pannus brasiliensis CCIBt3594]|uniref:UvrD-helicase domain-containing protein n=1 Tax=Pannus brasiliensis CCIBt3594 TaxID=1427578 RepID=A0AAW9QTL0_9CHRO
MVDIHLNRFKKDKLSMYNFTIDDNFSIASVEQLVQYSQNIAIDGSSLLKILVDREVERYDGVRGKVIGFDLKSNFVISLPYRIFTPSGIIEDSRRERFSLEKFSKNFIAIIPEIDRQQLQEFLIKENSILEERKQKIQAEQQAQEERRLQAVREHRLHQELERKEREERIRKKREEKFFHKETKEKLIHRLQDYFNKSFVDSEDFYKSECNSFVSFEEYERAKLLFVTSWSTENLLQKPDREQLIAISSVTKDIQVIARAGSGKTSTLVNRVLFLQKHCRIDPSEILILAFNKKAANEIQERLARSLRNSLPHVMTFHALAYALVHPDQEIVFDQSGGEQSQSKALQSVINDYLNDDSAYYPRIRDLMMAKFRRDWERLERKGYLLSQEEMLAYRRSLPREGLDGRYYKSFGEKVIANFLFEHDLDYKYERNYNWDGINYRPDFTIFTGNDRKQGIILEYFGLEGDPDYDEMSERKRQFWQRDDKRKQWKFLEFNPQQISSGEQEFSDLIKTSLENLAIECNKLSEDEIWEKAKRRAIDNFTKAMKQFVQLCRKRFLTPEELQIKIQDHESIDEFETEFLELGKVFYESYLAKLEVMGEEDFDGLMQTAIGLVESGNTIFSRKSGSGDLNRLKYILIDEYQDFSELFYRLIEAIRRHNQKALFFCVGDDWQSINGFAGSDLQYYQNFQQYFPNSLRLNISTNYRSASSIVTNGNILMQGLGKPARPYQWQSGIVKLVDLQSFEPIQREIEDHNGDCITPVILRLLNKIVITAFLVKMRYNTADS